MRHDPTELLVDAAGLTLDELASACSVSCEWVEHHVHEGLLEPQRIEGSVRFTSVHLLRARRLADVERIFEANEQLAAFVVDLIEELDRLRAQR